MINSINGVVASAADQLVVIDVGFLSLEVKVPAASSFKIKETIRLHTYLYWNQDNGPTLFGFSTELERTIFELIISCSGLGPKIGLSALADLGPEQFISAITAGDEDALSKVNGIGKKKAEQIIVQLRHKIKKLLDSGIAIGVGVVDKRWHNLTEALKSLNYSRTEITGAMDHVRELPDSAQLPFDHIMRAALSFLSRKV